jgi:hypothetical protein
MLILIGATGLRSWRAARRRGASSDATTAQQQAVGILLVRNGEKIAPKNTSALGFDRLVARPRR